jgi:hypothetical protein
MTIGQMRAAMTPREFSQWAEFYKLFPFDDRHRFHRPAAMVAAAFGGKYEDRLAFLSPDPVVAKFSRSDMGIMKALGVKPKAKEAA